AAGGHPLPAAAGARRVLPVGGLLRGQRPGRRGILPRAGHRARRGRDPAVAVLPHSARGAAPGPALLRQEPVHHGCRHREARETMTDTVADHAASPTTNLRVSLVQGATLWHDPDGNRRYYGELVASVRGMTDLVVLPETFTSGFSNEAGDDAEPMDGPTVDWMREQAGLADAAVTGSVQVRVGDDVFNRMLFVTPDGAVAHYDKRHLFRYAREHERYSPGRDRLTVEWRGWRICPMVCYDLRFPVFARNRFDVERPGALDYDLALFVANWPAARAHAWKTLLRARAIENLCFVAGLNRAGTDGN